MKQFHHNSADALQCLVEDFESYLDGSVEPDMESHQCSLDNALQVQELLGDVRELGVAIENGDPQVIADIWLRIKPQVELQNSTGSEISLQTLPTPVNLLNRLNPMVGKKFRGNFVENVKRLKRPYYRLSKGDFQAVSNLAGDSDVLLFDGKTQVTFGEADGGFALMPLRLPL